MIFANVRLQANLFVYLLVISMTSTIEALVQSVACTLCIAQPLSRMNVEHGVNNGTFFILYVIFGTYNLKSKFQKMSKPFVLVNAPRQYRNADK